MTLQFPMRSKVLPDAVGFGNTYSLHHAMMVDTGGELQKKVQRFSVDHYSYHACAQHNCDIGF